MLVIFVSHVLYELCSCWPKVILFIDTTKSNILITIFHNSFYQQIKALWWCFILSSALHAGSFLQLSNLIFQKATELNPTDPTTLYMLGSW